jgi:hypothetical protein
MQNRIVWKPHENSRVASGVADRNSVAHHFISRSIVTSLMHTHESVYSAHTLIIPGGLGEGATRTRYLHFPFHTSLIPFLLQRWEPLHMHVMSYLTIIVLRVAGKYRILLHICQHDCLTHSDLHGQETQHSYKNQSHI